MPSSVISALGDGAVGRRALDRPACRRSRGACARRTRNSLRFAWPPKSSWLSRIRIRAPPAGALPEEVGGREAADAARRRRPGRRSRPCPAAGPPSPRRSRRSARGPRRTSPRGCRAGRSGRAGSSPRPSPEPSPRGRRARSASGSRTAPATPRATPFRKSRRVISRSRPRSASEGRFMVGSPLEEGEHLLEGRAVAATQELVDGHLGAGEHGPGLLHPRAAPPRGSRPAAIRPRRWPRGPDSPSPAPPARSGSRRCGSRSRPRRAGRGRRSRQEPRPEALVSEAAEADLVERARCPGRRPAISGTISPRPLRYWVVSTTGSPEIAGQVKQQHAVPRGPAPDRRWPAAASAGGPRRRGRRDRGLSTQSLPRTPCGPRAHGAPEARRR